MSDEPGDIAGDVPSDRPVEGPAEGTVADRLERVVTHSAPAACEVWKGRATNRLQWPLAALGAACLALGVALAVGSTWPGGRVPLLMSIVGCVAAGLLILFGTLAFVKVSVLVDSEALVVRCGHAGVPRRRIPLRDIVAAEVAPAVTPSQWGGWGYRWRPGMGTAIVVRRGEGILLRLDDGRHFTVTVDDAESAVHAIRGWLARHTPHSGHSGHPGQSGQSGQSGQPGHDEHIDGGVHSERAGPRDHVGQPASADQKGQQGQAGHTGDTSTTEHTGRTRRGD